VILVRLLLVPVVIFFALPLVVIGGFVSLTAIGHTNNGAPTVDQAPSHTPRGSVAAPQRYTGWGSRRGARNPTSLCVPSQNGLLRDCPQRQSVTRLRTA
jgi:hypothetical protein